MSRTTPFTSNDFEGYLLNSVFQPIVSLSHRRIVGFEALLKTLDTDSRPIPAAECFDYACQSGQAQALDQLCQQLHIRNFSRLGSDNRWLFLNIDPASINGRHFDDGTLESVLANTGLPAHLLVVEIVEGAITDETLLREAVAYFRSLGAMVALDDFGAGHSNFDRIWRLAPDIIKLDRSLIVEAEQHQSDRLRRMLPNLVALMHEAGSMVLAEGIETVDQALMAIDSGLDFAQGFYFARPTPDFKLTDAQTHSCLEQLTQELATESIIQDRRDIQDNAPYIRAFRTATEAIEQGQPIAEAIHSLLNMPRTARFYILDSWGEEISYHLGTLRSQRALQTSPIADTRGGTWYRRPYFRAALNTPNQLQVSQPYLSSTTACVSTTLSIACGTPVHHVLCCDIG